MGALPLAKRGSRKRQQGHQFFSTREQVILLVVSQYIGTLRAMATVEASQIACGFWRKRFTTQAADLQKEGVGTGIDTLRANVEAAEREASTCWWRKPIAILLCLD